MSAVPGRAKARVTLPADDQVLIEREFAAPKHVVYRAFTEPDLIRRWWHARRGEVTVVEVDLRVGGSWRYAMVTPDGREVAFHGSYLEIVPGERIVTTELFEGAPAQTSDSDVASVNTASFASVQGGTKLTILIQAPSRAVRDATIATGMEDGLQDALDLLAEVAGAIADAV
jgi:uncharacterized protein YndB with AHSA1/START domain